MLKLVPRPGDAARDLLRRPDLLALMTADLDAMGLVGEAENKQLLYLAMVSRLLPQPVNVVVKGPSSSGKSLLVSRVADLFGPEIVLTLSQLTSRALYYMGAEALRHRVLYIDEYVAHRERDHALRLIQSEGRLHMASTARNSEGLATETRTVNGPLAFITTTTRSHIFEKNETRAFALHMDESVEQTHRIHDAERRARGFDRPSPVYAAEVWQQAAALMAPYPVVIPYAEHVHLVSTGRPRDRRDLGRLFSLVEASALAHQHRRRQVERDDGIYLEADLADYEVAWRLSKAFLTAPAAIDASVEAVVAACGSFGEEGVSHYQLMEVLGWSRPTVIKHCQKALQAGYLKRVVATSGPQKRYQVGDNLAGSPTLTSPDVVAAWWNGRHP